MDFTKLIEAAQANPIVIAIVIGALFLLQKYLPAKPPVVVSPAPAPTDPSTPPAPVTPTERPLIDAFIKLLPVIVPLLTKAAKEEAQKSESPK